MRAAVCDAYSCSAAILPGADLFIGSPTAWNRAKLEFERLQIAEHIGGGRTDAGDRAGIDAQRFGAFDVADAFNHRAVFLAVPYRIEVAGQRHRFRVVRVVHHEYAPLRENR